MGFFKPTDGKTKELNEQLDNIEKKIDDHIESCSSGSGSGEGLTTEQAQQLTTAYQHSQSYHVSMIDVNSAINSAIGGIEGGGDVSLYTGLLMDCLGDSITARNVYEGMIKEQLGFSNVLNHGIGGSCICGDNENCFWHDNRINALDENADVVLFTGGSNDWQTSKEMGDISSTDTNTFYGACKTMIKKLINKYPRKLLLGATAIYGYQQALPNQLNSHNLKLSDYMNAFKECCNLYNIPVADVFFECGINSYNKEYYFGDTDGTKSDDFLHPNKEYGHPKIANCIVKKLKQLTPVIAYVENDPNTYGNVVVSTNTLAANEGATTTFTVYLDGAPSTTQTVSISADNEDVTFSPSSLSFTETNYSKPQTVKVNIASDGDADSEVANINVSSKKNTQYITLNITDLTTPEPVESVNLSLSSKSLYEGNSFELTATVLPESAANKNVTWSANNSNVTLNPSGLKCGVVANNSGSSVVTVTTGDGSKTAVCNITVMSKTVEVGQNMFSSASKIVYRSGRTQSGASYDDSTNTFRFNLESGNMAGIVVPCSPSTSYTFTASNRTGIQGGNVLNIQYYSGEPTYVQHDEEYLIKTDTWSLPSSDNTAERKNTLTTPVNCQYIGVSTYANATGEGSVVLTCVQNA